MPREESGSETERTDGYKVECERCDEVEFDVIDENWFANPHAASWYAGYHSGKEHPDSRFQDAMPTRCGEDDDGE